MSRKTAILVVEDRPILIDEVYKEAFSTIDAEVDYASNKYEALEKVKCKTYDVAFIDIMLSDDISDRGGVEVVKYLNQLNEGTSMIVVSGTEDIKVAINTYNAGIMDFMHKNPPPIDKDILDRLNKALACKKNINYFGRFSTLTAYLAAPELVYSWEMAIMSHLGVGYNTINNALWEVLERMFPIMRKKSGCSFTMNNQPHALIGSFWSKGLGKPIWISIAGQNNELISPPQEAIQEEIYKHQKGKIFVGIWTMTGIRRDDYCDSIWDEIR
jgi:ActR/RegA family two-component response regulator